MEKIKTMLKIEKKWNLTYFCLGFSIGFASMILLIVLITIPFINTFEESNLFQKVLYENTTNLKENCDIETILKPLQNREKIILFCQDRKSDTNYLGWQNGKIINCFDKTQDNTNIKYSIQEYLNWNTFN